MLVYFVNHSSALDHLGGSERSLFRLIDEWLAADPDLEPYFITKSPPGLVVAELEKRGWGYTALTYRGWAVPPHDAHPDQVAYHARDDYLATQEIVRLMEERRPDLVVTNTLVAPWGAFAAKILGIPHAWMVREFGDLDHGLAFTNGRENTLSDIGLLSEAVFANSSAIRDHLATFMPAEKISIVYPTVDTDAVLAQSQESLPTPAFASDAEALTVTVVGRLAPSKGQWRVIEAVGQLHDSGIRADVCFVGASMQPEYQDRLADRARELGIAHQVTFVGEQENPFPFAAAADVCITPSSHEAFGRTTLEYMWLGKPVIATNRGGSTELVHDGVTGFLVDPDGVSDLADRLARYAQAPRLVADHGRAARERAATFAAPDVSNAAAIERLRQLVGAPAYRLPNIARQWLALPTTGRSRRRTAGATVKYFGRVLVIRARNFVRDPIGSSRRRLAALRASRG